MSSLISIRVNDKEEEIISKISKLNNCGISSWIKKIVYENIENEYDIKTIMEYEKDKKKDIKTKPIENLFEELGV